MYGEVDHLPLFSYGSGVILLFSGTRHLNLDEHLISPYIMLAQILELSLFSFDAEMDSFSSLCQ